MKLSDNFKSLRADALAPTDTTVKATPSAYTPPYFFQDFLIHKTSWLWQSCLKPQFQEQYSMNKTR